ncbi:MAG: endonuclease/exonuclease/phosphatase family protein [Endozoicomonas sp. (ex Botrylloides leachii)]|nr:endonuclease/exonuclease/phosphatase family protein [Endozoicomonas sp. (ex Botrylloides leachii)]
MPIKVLQSALSRRVYPPTPEQVNCSELNFTYQKSFSSTIKLLSYNIQVGINTQLYRHYITRGWQHLFPNAGRVRNLNRIADLLAEFDLVALQEIDGGSIRTGFINQAEYLAVKGHFPFWYQQLNRNLGKIAQQSNGLLSRFKPSEMEDHKLPGLISGRGAIVAYFGHKSSPLVVIVMHLALGQRVRNMQLSYIRDLIQGYQHIVLMGDMNTHAEQLLNDSPLRDTPLQSVHWDKNTFPSWNPKRSLDHILISPLLKVKQVEVLNVPISDHLPIAVEIELPDYFRT